MRICAQIWTPFQNFRRTALTRPRDFPLTILAPSVNYRQNTFISPKYPKTGFGPTMGPFPQTLTLICPGSNPALTLPLAPYPNLSSLTLAAIEIVARVNGRHRTGKIALPTPKTTVDSSTLTMVHPWRIEVLSMILGVFCSDG